MKLTALLLLSLAPLTNDPLARTVDPRVPSPHTLDALRASDDPALATLRAGRRAAPVLADSERSELRRADELGTELHELRAGLTEREWTLIAVGAVVVLVLILI
jgi:hypothetical protein